MSETKPVNHHTREPHQPTYAVIVEGVLDGTIDSSYGTDYQVKLDCVAPGNVEFTLVVNGKTCGKLPFDNLVKAATRIDPDYAVGTERQIQQLRREVADAKAERYDWEARAKQLEERVNALRDASKV